MTSFLLILSFFLNGYNTRLNGTHSDVIQGFLLIALVVTAIWHFLQHGFLNTVLAVLIGFVLMIYTVAKGQKDQWQRTQDLMKEAEISYKSRNR